MGSGTGCDGQYLFAKDVLGSHTGHIPRHAKTYRRFYDESIAAFKEFKADVHSGDFPQAQHIVAVDEAEFAAFQEALQIRSAS